MNRKHYFFIFLFLTFHSFNSEAQVVLWGKSIGGSGNELGNSITVDLNGNTYICGHFTNEIIFGVDTIYSSGSQDVFIAKLNSQGTLQWYICGGGLNADEAQKLVFDGHNSIYLTGYFNGQFILGGDTLDSGTGNSAFLAKFSTDGNLIWLNRIGSGTQSNFNPHELIMENSNSFYIGGSFSGPLILDSISLFSNGPASCLIARFDSIGHWHYGITFGNGNYDNINSLTLDSIGNLYAAGEFSDFSLLLGNTGLFVGSNSYVSFIAKLNLTTDTWNWAKIISGGTSSSAQKIVWSKNNSIYVGGLVNESCSFDTIHISHNIGTNASDFYLAKFDTAANIQWVKVSNSNGLPNQNNGLTDLAVDKYGNSFIGGYINLMCNYGDSIYTSSVTQDAFFAKTNNNGDVEWFNHFGGVNPTVDRIYINDFGQLTICGEFDSQMQLGSSILDCQGNQDVFVAKCFYNLTQEKLCTVSGHAFIDINNSCSYDLGIDINLKNAIVSAIPGPTYAITNDSGYYELNLNPGSYVVSEISPDSSLFEPTCQTSFNLNLINRFDSIEGIDFVNQSNTYCSKLFIDYAGLRSIRNRCWIAPGYSFAINYGNLGNLIAQNVSIEYRADPYFYLTNSSIPYNQNGNIYTFNIGDLMPLQIGSISFTENIQCAYPPNSLRCCHLKISPNMNCSSLDSIAIKNKTEISGECLSNDSIKFILRNQNLNGTNQNGIYKIFENNIIVYSDTFSLPFGDSLLIYWQANGATIRLEINHIDFINKINYDGQVFSIEGCGSNPTYDQINQLPLTNLRNEKDICIPVGVSRDPNDKEVYPSGIGSNSLVDPDKYLEYTIQFQNTGTDTAFYISIYDTLSPYLNLATFQMISSSLSFNLQQFPNNILKWTCQNALLPDSNIDSQGSNGFLTFRIKPISNPIPGTAITNKAGIVFDFNEPVITNNTLSTIAALPVSIFQISNQSGNTIDFLNTSLNSTRLWWSFGDGSFDTTGNPQHIYPTVGLYNICLFAANDLGSDLTCQQINITTNSVQQYPFSAPILFPNPSFGSVELQADSKIIGVTIKDYTGKILRKYKKEDLSGGLSVENLNSGMYYFGIYYSDQTSINLKLVVIK